MNAVAEIHSSITRAVERVGPEPSSGSAPPW